MGVKFLRMGWIQHPSGRVVFLLLSKHNPSIHFNTGKEESICIGVGQVVDLVVERDNSHQIAAVFSAGNERGGESIGDLRRQDKV